MSLSAWRLIEKCFSKVKIVSLAIHFKNLDVAIVWKRRIFDNEIRNKYKQDGRAYFPPSNFVKDSFLKKRKRLRNTLFSANLVNLWISEDSENLERKGIVMKTYHFIHSLRQIKFFFKKSSYFLVKTHIFVRMDKKCYYFVRILQQICHNLVMRNFQTQNRAIVQSCNCAIVQLASIGRKRVQRVDYFTSIFIWGVGEGGLIFFQRLKLKINWC